jgi:hypothetical protein
MLIFNDDDPPTCWYQEDAEGKCRDLAIWYRFSRVSGKWFGVGYCDVHSLLYSPGRATSPAVYSREEVEQLLLEKEVEEIMER